MSILTRVGVLASTALLCLSAQAAKMTAHFIDVGQGAATLLEFPCGAVLIDTGGETSIPLHYSSNALLKSYLDAFFERRSDLDYTLDAVYLSHPHPDHTRGVAVLLKEANGYDIRNVIDNAQNTGLGVPQQKNLRAWAKENASYKGIKIRDVNSTEGYTSDIVDPLGSCEGVNPKIRVLWGSVKTKPAAWNQEEFKDENNHSLVIRVDFGSASFLFPGDLEEPGERSLMKKFKDTDLLDVDVYQLAHHGSHTGNITEFLEAMSPVIAVIPDGNVERQHSTSAWKYGHPRAIVVDRVLAELPRSRATPIDAPVAVGVKNFEPRTIDKALYATGWDGNVQVDADSDGTYAFKNSLATFVHRRREFEVIMSVDKCFQSVGQNLDDPSNFVAAMFLLRSHSAYRASVRLATSGQVPETFPLLRSCIEYALYALHIDTHTALAEIWIRREDDEAALRKCRREFAHSKVIKTLADTDPNLHKAIHALYERTIQYGAHPNERGVSVSARFTDTPDQNVFQGIYLSGEGEAIPHSMRATAQVGVGSLSIFERIFTERFRNLGLNQELHALRSVL